MDELSESGRIMPLRQRILGKINKKKSGTDTKSENNNVKSDETYVQIFKCHFDPFFMKWSNKLFSKIGFWII